MNTTLYERGRTMLQLLETAADVLNYEEKAEGVGKRVRAFQGRQGRPAMVLVQCERRPQFYAAYTAMWPALGDPVPPHTRWRHEGIVKSFALGWWRHPGKPLCRELRKALGLLYKYRIRPDYHGLKVTMSEAQEGLAMAAAVLASIANQFACRNRG